MHEDPCYEENEIVITLANHYGLGTKTDEDPTMPLTPRRKSLEMDAFEYQECMKDHTAPKFILTGKDSSHQDGGFRRSLPASCVKSSPRLASAMSAPGDSVGAVSRRAAGAARQAASSAPAIMMKDALGAGARAGCAQSQRRSTVGSAEDVSASTQNVRTTAQSKVPTATH